MKKVIWGAIAAAAVAGLFEQHFAGSRVLEGTADTVRGTGVSAVATVSAERRSYSVRNAPNDGRYLPGPPPMIGMSR